MHSDGQSYSELPPISNQARSELSVKAAKELDQLLQEEHIACHAIFSPSRREHQLCEYFHKAIKEDDPVCQAIALQQLGDLYLQRAGPEQATASGNSYPAAPYHKASALYNAALMRTYHESHKEKLYKRLENVERRFLEGLCGFDRQVTNKLFGLDPKKRALKHKEKLKDIRSSINEYVTRIEEMWQDLFGSEDKGIIRGQELDIRREIFNVRKKMKQDMRGLLKEMCEECLQILPRPPCSYALTGLGDMALDDLTPYGSIELLVLIEDSNSSYIEYFRKMVWYLQLKIINLGETPLAVVGVKLVHDFYNKGIDVLLDPYECIGVHVTDHLIQSKGLVKSNGVIPIATPKSLAAIQLQAVKSGSLELAYKLLQSTLIKGDVHVLDDYRLRLGHPSTLRAEIIKETLLKSLWCFDLMPKFRFIKTDIELTRLFIELSAVPKLIFSLKIMFQLKSRCLWKIIEEMKTRFFISDEAEHDMRMALALAYYLRLRSQFVQQGNHCLSDIFQCLMNLNGDLNEQDVMVHAFGMDVTQMLVRMYLCIMPLVQYLRSYGEYKKKTPLVSIDFFKYDPQVAVYVLWITHQYEECLSALKDLCFKKGRKSFEVPVGEHIKLCLAGGKLSLYQLKSKDAATFYRKALELNERRDEPIKKSLDFIQIWSKLGLIELLENQPTKASTHFDEAFQRYQEMVKNHPKLSGMAEASDALSELHEHLGLLNVCRGNIRKAKQHTEKACGLQSKLNTTLQPPDVLHIVHLHTEIGRLSNLLGDFKGAKTELRKALSLLQSLGAPTSTTLLLSEIYHEIGNSSDGLGKPITGAMYKGYGCMIAKRLLGDVGSLMSSSDMSEYEDRVVYVDGFGALKHYAELLHAAGHHIKSLTLFNLCIDQANISWGENGFSFVKGISHGGAGMCSVALGEHTESLVHFQRILESVNSMFNENEKVPIRTKCLRLICDSYIQLGELNKAATLMITANEINNELTVDAKSPLETMCLLNTMSNIKVHEGDLVGAVESMAHNIKQAKAVYGQLHPEIAGLTRKLAEICLLQGSKDKALRHLCQTVEILQKVYSEGQSSQDLVDIHLEVGKIYLEKGCHEQAEDAFRKAVLNQKILSSEKVSKTEAINAYVYLGKFYKAINHLDQEIESFTEAYTMAQDLDQTDPGKLAEVTHLLAESYQSARLYTDACRLYEEAISLHRKTSADSNDTLQVAELLRSLGNAYEGLHESEKAAECHMVSLHIKRRILGHDAADKNIVQSFVKVAKHYESRGELRKALKYLRQALDRNLQIPWNLSTQAEKTKILDRLIDLCIKLGEFASAMSYNKQLYQTSSDLYLEAHASVEVAKCFQRAGKIHEGLGEFGLAVENYEKALEIFRISHNTDMEHQDIVECCCSIGHALVNTTESERAMEVLQSAISTARKLQLEGNNREVLAQTLHEAGSACEFHPLFPKACEYHEEALKIREDMYKDWPTNVHLIQSYIALGNSYCATKTYATGEAMLLKAISLLKNSSNKDTEKLIYTQICLSQAYISQSKLAKAQEQLQLTLALIKENSSGRSTLHSAKCLSLLADVCYTSSKKELSLKYANQALEAYGEILQPGTEHPDAAHLCEVVGDIHSQHNPREALKWYKRSAQSMLILYNNSLLNRDLEEVIRKIKSVQDLV